ncbi:uncharacterized protein LOC132731739 [Ruditapes philippinarum]|uniref:uncharacterized protein LOC132731739 n=1 Tax=Ruditapes philippinarum TaxID=129788 RepID=UPI00295BB2AA|nr:uncharacterized protein LOC132731739 [Ruditapes philippinarum]
MTRIIQQYFNMADISGEKLRRKIKEILKDADLSTLSAKKVRLELQKAFDIDLSERKKEIDKMTMTLILEMEEQKKSEEKEDSEKEEDEEQNGQDKSGSGSDQEEEPPKKKTKVKEKPAKKKGKKKKGGEDDDDDDDLAPLENDDLMAYDEEQKTLKLSDEELAKRLQSFEETGRRTRGKATPKRKEKKKGGGGGNSAYSRPCLLSPELAGVMGTDKLARNEIVKKMWEIVKERKLQDPKDKRFMICDEQLQKVFGRKRVKTFGMMKYLSSQLRDESSSLEAVITNSDIYDDEADDD